MAKAKSGAVIRLRGVRHNNLKGFDLDLPTRQLVVVTGPSGSGKSSLAFDTLFAEGQRRYVETFSPYARQFFDRMDKPRVDSIEGIPPAIAIEQRNTVRTTRSTVGTMTELCDYLKVLWPHVAELHCRQCGEVVHPEPPMVVWGTVPRGVEGWVTFELRRSAKVSLEESLALIQRQGFQRLWVEGRVVRVEEAAAEPAVGSAEVLTVVQDRLRLESAHRARFVEACEQAYHFGKGRLSVWWEEEGAWVVKRFSRHLHCARCDIEYGEPTPAMFSFNHPAGACPTCRGFGRTITIDYGRAVPDRSRTIAQGLVRPWQSGMSAECQRDLLRFCKSVGIPVGIPFEQLKPEWQRWVVDGDPEYGKDEEHEWPRAWYGVKGYFRWLESKSYKMHVRVLLSRYRAYVRCPDCEGRRLRSESLLYRVRVPGGTDSTARDYSLADLCGLTVRAARDVMEGIAKGCRRDLSEALHLALAEVESRLAYLLEVGLGYLALDRPTRTLSGGETERVNLTTCLGTRLVNTLYVLDEPSVGLHARDTGQLVRVLERLRDLGNTVVVVEHEAAVIRAADHIVDLGPGHGEAGGDIVFAGPAAGLRRSKLSLTGQYLYGGRRVEAGRRRPVDREQGPHLALRRASMHNLTGIELDIPLRCLVCVTGVSGSGKTTLVREVLYPLLVDRLAPEGGVGNEGELVGGEGESGAESEVAGGVNRGSLTGAELLGQVVLVDQSPIGRTPRSNPAVYIGAFEFIRDVFAGSDEARRLGLGSSAFSFNSVEGQCERCRGAGFERIEMQFLSDVFIRCPDCEGRRYRDHVLQVRIGGEGAEVRAHQSGRRAVRREAKHAGRRGRWNIADVLAATVDGAVEFLGRLKVPAAAKAVEALAWLQLVGLGYLRLGQPINTLSGGESQRLKLVGSLAEFSRVRRANSRPAMFLLDEPTTGLHFDDVRVLMEAIQKLIEAGHSVVVVEHNLDVIRGADWIIDLGPEAGEEGGRIVVEGPVEAVMACEGSHTGRALRESEPPRMRKRGGRSGRPRGAMMIAGSKTSDAIPVDDSVRT